MKAANIPRHLQIGVAVLLVIVVAMFMYARRVRRKANELEAAASQTLPVAPPTAGPTENVSLYIADDSSGELRAQSAEIPLAGGRQQRAEEIVRALLHIYQQPGAAHPLTPASELRSIYLIEPGSAIIDLNRAFADGHRSGILTEQLTVDSLVETVAVNVAGIHSVKILIDGATRETLAGHADLTNWFDVATVEKASSE
jgi:hypothetical protein